MTTKEEKLDHTVLTFGRHRGKTPSEVAEIAESYIVWLYETIKPERCSKALYLDCKGSKDADDNGIPDARDVWESQDSRQ